MAKTKTQPQRRRRPLKVGALLDSALSAHDQTRVLLQLKALLDAESTKQQRAAQARRQRARAAQPASVVARRTAKQRQKALLLQLHTSTDPATIREARRQLDAEFNDPAERSPSAAEQQRTGRAASVIAHHQPGRAPYWPLIGPAPHCEPGDTRTAMVFLRKLDAAIERGGWTNSERAALYDLRAKWAPRALGTDPRFMLVGTMPGRLPKALEAKIKQLRLKGTS